MYFMKIPLTALSERTGLPDRLGRSGGGAESFFTMIRGILNSSCAWGVQWE